MVLAGLTSDVAKLFDWRNCFGDKLLRCTLDSRSGKEFSERFFSEGTLFASITGVVFISDATPFLRGWFESVSVEIVPGHADSFSSAFLATSSIWYWGRCCCWYETGVLGLGESVSLGFRSTSTAECLKEKIKKQKNIYLATNKIKIGNRRIFI